MKPGATTSPLASISRFAAPGDLAHRDDLIAADGEIAIDPRIAGAIDEFAVTDDEVVGGISGDSEPGDQESQEKRTHDWLRAGRSD